MNADVFAGLDWATQVHSVCILNASGGVLERFEVAHDRDGLAELLRRLARYGTRVRIAIERPSGLIVDALVEAGHQVFPIHPNAVKASALRWHTLAQRLASDPTVPREVASQAIQWRNEATAKAEADPEAKRMLEWGREAEAFRTLPRNLFLREFPQHAKAVERLEEAMSYAEKTIENASDRERFVEQARDRLAQRIAEGRYGPPAGAKTKEREPRAR